MKTISSSFISECIIFALAAVLICTGCQHRSYENSTSNLTSDGFIELFNGRDLTGWERVRGGQWKVKDSILYTEGDEKGWLSTVREYDNFELELDFRLPPGGNSGVFLRIPRRDGGRPAYAGMEIQVLDDYAEQYAKLEPWHYTGSIYGVQAPAKRISKKAGQWQKMIIVCNGPRIRVSLNGELIVNADLRKHKDKIQGHPGLKRSRGYIGLQHHNTRVEYRNIRIKQL
jgi:3-keto-disaccharide hydrolase